MEGPEGVPGSLSRLVHTTAAGPTWKGDGVLTPDLCVESAASTTCRLPPLELEHTRIPRPFRLPRAL